MDGVLGIVVVGKPITRPNEGLKGSVLKTRNESVLKTELYQLFAEITKIHVEQVSIASARPAEI